jgi:hypothetical protein
MLSVTVCELVIKNNFDANTGMYDGSNIIKIYLFPFEKRGYNLFKVLKTNTSNLYCHCFHETELYLKKITKKDDKLDQDVNKWGIKRCLNI